MKSVRYVYVKLSNQGRQNKKESQKRNQKPVHQQYLKSRLTMDWRIKQFAKKQNFQSITPNQMTYMQPYIRDQYVEYRKNITRTFGGGVYFKKMSRMDKVRLKERLKQNKQYQGNQKQKFIEIFHKLRVKFEAWQTVIGFYTIREQRKPIRNIQYVEQQRN